MILSINDMTKKIVIIEETSIDHTSQESYLLDFLNFTVIVILLYSNGRNDIVAEVSKNSRPNLNHFYAFTA